MNHDEITKILGSPDAAAQAVGLLGSYDLVVRGPLFVRDAKSNAMTVLDAKGAEVVGAYPLTTEATPHQVKINGHDVHAICAVDALAVAPMFDLETRVSFTCNVTGEAITIHQRGKRLIDAKPSRQVRVGVRWQRVIDCAAHVLCRQMVFLKDAEIAADWQSSAPVYKSIFTLEEAIEFGEAFFRPLLEN